MSIQVYGQMVFPHNFEKPNRGILRIICDEIQKIQNPSTRISILDIGCGSGKNSIELARHLQADLVGIDHVKDVLIRAKKVYPEGEWVLLNANTLNIKKASFDIVLLIFVIHLLRNPNSLLKKLAQVLKKPNGRLFIVTVDHDQLTTGIYAKYFPEASQLDLRRFPSVAALRELLAELGFRTWIRTHRYFQRVTDEISVQSWVQKVHQRSFSSFDVYSPEELAQKLCQMESALTQQIRHKKISLRRKTTIICAQCLDDFKDK